MRRVIRHGTDFSEGIRTVQRGDKEKLQASQVRIERDAGNAIINHRHLILAQFFSGCCMRRVAQITGQVLYCTDITRLGFG